MLESESQSHRLSLLFSVFPSLRQAGSSFMSTCSEVDDSRFSNVSDIA